MPSVNDKQVSAIKRKRSTSPSISVNEPNFSFHEQAIEIAPHSYSLRIKSSPKLKTDCSPKKKTVLSKPVPGKKLLQESYTKTKKSHDHCSLCNHFLPLDSTSCVCFSCLSKYSQPKTYKSSRRSVPLGTSLPKINVIDEKQKTIDNALVIKPKEIVSVIGRFKQRRTTLSNKLALGAHCKSVGLKKKSGPKLNSIENDLFLIRKFSEARNIELEKAMKRSRKRCSNKTNCEEAIKEDESRLTALSSNKSSTTVGSPRSTERSPIRKRFRYDDENVVNRNANEDEVNRNANEDLLSIQKASAYELSKFTKTASNRPKKKTNCQPKIGENKTVATVNEDSPTAIKAVPTAGSSKSNEKIQKRLTKKNGYNVEIKAKGTDLVPDKTAFAEEPVLKRSMRTRKRNEINNKNAESAPVIVSKPTPIVESFKNTEKTAKQSKTKSGHRKVFTPNGTGLDINETASTKKEAVSKVKSATAIKQASKRPKKWSKYKDENKSLNADSDSSTPSEAFPVAGSSKNSEQTPKQSKKKTARAEGITIKGTDLDPDEKALSTVRMSKSIEQPLKQSKKRSTCRDEIKNSIAESASLTLSEKLPNAGSSKDTVQTAKLSKKKTVYAEEITTNATDLDPEEIASTEEEASTVRFLKSIEQPSKQSKKRSMCRDTIKKLIAESASLTLSEELPIAGSSKNTEQTPKQSKRKTLCTEGITTNGTDSGPEEVASTEEEVLAIVRLSKSTEKPSKRSKKRSMYRDALKNLIAESASLTMSEELPIAESSKDFEQAPKQSKKKTGHAEGITTNGTELDSEIIASAKDIALSKMRLSKSIEQPLNQAKKKSTYKDEKKNKTTASTTICRAFPIEESFKDTEQKQKATTEKTLLDDEVTKNKNTLNTYDTASSKRNVRSSMRSKNKIQYDEQNQNRGVPDNDLETTDTAIEVLPSKPSSMFSECSSMQSTSDTEGAEDSQNTEIMNETSLVVNFSNVLRRTSVESTGSTKSDRIQENESAKITNRRISTENEASTVMKSSQSSELSSMESKKNDKNYETRAKEAVEVAENTTTTENKVPSSMSLPQSPESSAQSKKMAKFDEKIEDKTMDIEVNGITVIEVLPSARFSKSSEHTSLQSTDKSQIQGIVDEIVNEACSDIRLSNILKCTSVESTESTKSNGSIQENVTAEIASETISTANEAFSAMKSPLPAEDSLVQSQKNSKSDNKILKEETIKIANNTIVNDASLSLRSSRPSDPSLLQSKKIEICNDEILENKTPQITNIASSPGSRSPKQAKCANNCQGNGTPDITKEACSFVREASPVVTSSKSTEQLSTKKVECRSDLQTGVSDKIVEIAAKVNPTVKSAVVTRSKRLKSSKEKMIPLNTAGTARETDVVRMAADSSDKKDADVNKKTYKCNICQGVFSYRQSFRFHHNKCNLRSKIQSTMSVENDFSPTLPDSSEIISAIVTDKCNNEDVSFDESNKINSISTSTSPHILLPDVTEGNTSPNVEEENLANSSPNIDSLQPSVEEKSVSNESDANIESVLPCLKTNELFFDSKELLIQNWKNAEHKNESRFNIEELALSGADSSLGIQNWANSVPTTESFFNTAEISVDAIESCFNASELSLSCPFDTAEIYLDAPECLEIQNLRNTDHKKPYLNTTDCPASSVETQNLENGECKTAEPSLNVTVFPSTIQNWENTELSMNSNANQLSLGTRKPSLGNQNWQNSECTTELALEETSDTAPEESQVNLDELESLLQCQEQGLEDSSKNPSSEIMEYRLQVSESVLQCPKSFFKETEPCLEDKEPSFDECNSTLQVVEFQTDGLNDNLNQIDLSNRNTCLLGTESTLDEFDSPLVEDSSNLERLESCAIKSNPVNETTDCNLRLESRKEEVGNPTAESSGFDPNCILREESHGEEVENPNSESSAFHPDFILREESQMEEVENPITESSTFDSACILREESHTEVENPIDESNAFDSACIFIEESRTEEVENPITESSAFDSDCILIEETRTKEVENPIPESITFDSHASGSNEEEFVVLNSEPPLTVQESYVGGEEEAQYYSEQVEYGTPFAGRDIEATASSEEQANADFLSDSPKSPSLFCPRIVDFFSLPEISDDPKSNSSSNPESPPAVSNSLNKETAAKRTETRRKKSNGRKNTSSDEAQKSEGSAKKKRRGCNASGSSATKGKRSSDDGKQPLVSEGSSAPKKKSNRKEVSKGYCSCGKPLPVPSPPASTVPIDDQRASIPSDIAGQASTSRQNVNVNIPSITIQDTFRYHFSNFMHRNEEIIQKNMRDVAVFEKSALSFLETEESKNSKPTASCASAASANQVNNAGILPSPVAERTFDSASTFSDSHLAMMDVSDGYSTGNLPDTPAPSLSNPMSPLSCTSLSDPLPHISQVEREDSLVADADEVIFTEDFRQPYDVFCRDRASDSYLCHYCFKNLKKNEIPMHFYTMHNRTCKRKYFNLLAD